ncbi:hypothetical protein [Pseudomonas palleroniana]|uniref:hypothetical protein n=1 Tax=Pseudomonas palleroniana TaxID=191390 RepID=UPI0018E666DF|nr:hypothetical protein [Pseudomonas palleroniana]MBI6911034.1 hypothetical protein [Pseudomonas palleroniana]
MDSAHGFLGQEGAAEIQRRNAGSRAYYALFHAALQAIRHKELPLLKVPGAGSHESVIATLCSMGPSAKSIGESMSRIKRFRHDCDYHVDMPIGLKKTAMQISEAQILIGKLSRL